MGKNLKTKEPYKVVESSSSKDNFVVLLYKYDPSKPTKNFDPNSMQLGRNPEAGNIFVTKEDDEQGKSYKSVDNDHMCINTYLQNLRH